jgi:hypothetical protein
MKMSTIIDVVVITIDAICIAGFVFAMLVFAALATGVI